MKPAAAAIRLLYWNTSPNRLVGWVAASWTKVLSTGVSAVVVKSHS